MKIVGITACPTGIAHTYITKKKILEAAKECGYPCRIETQGSIGAEDELTPQEIADADVVLLAVDVKIAGENRFTGKPIVKVRTEDVMRNTAKFLQQIEEKLKAAGRL